MALEDRIKRLEDSGLLGDELVLDDGTRIRCAQNEIFHALVAVISEKEHRLIPAIYQASGELVHSQTGR